MTVSLINPGACDRSYVYVSRPDGKWEWDIHITSGETVKHLSFGKSIGITMLGPI